MKDLSKKEFTALYFIELGRTNIDRLSSIIENPKEIIKSLEEKDLVKIEMRGEKIYGFIETKKGKDVLNSEKYQEWLTELEGEW